MKKITQRIVLNVPRGVSSRLQRAARTEGTTVNQIVLRLVTNHYPAPKKNAMCSLADLPLKYNVTREDADELEKVLLEMRTIEPELWK
ncbi:MAG: hypothetical protein LBK76_03705 [Verrucomicrobiales bacterium]|nr:hypothetical protein [Verrucomicrobiales bacterium]